MIEYIMQCIVAMLTAVALENAIFTRAWGTSRMIFQIKDLKSILLFGTMVTGIGTASVACNYPLYSYLVTTSIPSYYRSLLYIFCIVVVYLIVVVVLKKFFPVFYDETKLMLSLASFNCSVHGSLLITVGHRYDFFMGIFYALGSGIGFTLAMLMIYAGRKRIEILNVPRAFRGLPILLVYIGILSLAIYGLIGHQLPT